MKVTIEDIKSLRSITGAGLNDVKTALTEAKGDMEKAKELLKERGQAIAAKRSDRETYNGCVLTNVKNEFAAILTLKCETDFVAKGKDYIAITQKILDYAIEVRARDIDTILQLMINGNTVSDIITEKSGITGEKIELGDYFYMEGTNISVYNHMNKNTLCTMVQLNKDFKEQGHAMALQIAAMNPISLNSESVPRSIIDSENKIILEKTKQEQSSKKINDTILENIVKGRLNKFFKENCLLEQSFIQNDELSVEKYLKLTDPELTVIDFKRFSLTNE